MRISTWCGWLKPGGPSRPLSQLRGTAALLALGTAFLGLGCQPPEPPRDTAPEIAAPAPVPAKTPPSPLVMGLEGQSLAALGWTVDASSATDKSKDSTGVEVAATLSRELPKSGETCAALVATGDIAKRPHISVRAEIDPGLYRGKRVRLAGYVRSQVMPYWFAGSNLSVRVGVKGRTRSFALGDRIQNPEWNHHEVLAEIPATATSLELVLSLSGPGKACFDDLSFAVVGEVGEGNLPARVPSERELRNLTAFARLYGYVRYFHPSDEVAGLGDWDGFVIDGIRAVESAGNAGELARILGALFAPIAPTVAIAPTGSPLPAVASGGAREGRVYTYWHHTGVGIEGNVGPYSSRRMIVGDAMKVGEGGLYQVLDARSYRGKRIRLRGAARAEVDGKTGTAHMYIAVVRENGQEGFVDEMLDRPIIERRWDSYEITGKVDDDATRLAVGLDLKGEGRAYFDQLSLWVDGTLIAELDNRGFEKGVVGEVPTGWRHYNHPGPRYRSAVVGTKPRAGRRAVLITRDPAARVSLPTPERPLVVDLGDVRARVPLAVVTEGKRTVPVAQPGSDLGVPPRPEGFFASGNDRATRLAGAIIGWNVFQHFYPYFDVVETDWTEVLETSLREAAVAKDEVEHLFGLRRLVAKLHDGHGNVRHEAYSQSHALPVIWAWVQGQLVITAVTGEAAKVLRPGDVVRALDRRPVADWVAELSPQISAAAPQWRQWRLLGDLRSGTSAGPVALAVSYLGAGPERAVTLRRIERGKESDAEETRPEPIATLEPGIMYIDYERATMDDIRAAAAELAKARGIVIDARGYPRNGWVAIEHLIDRPVDSARWLVPIQTRPDRLEMKMSFSNWSLSPKAPRFRGKIAFLIDGRAISAAETYLGIVEHYKLGAIVGEATAGTNGNINPFTAPGGYTMWWTGMRVLKHDGSQHHGIGILPTIPAARTIAGVAAGRDELLERGIEAVR